MSTTKVKGFHLPLDTIKFLEKTSKEVRLPESRIVEGLIESLRKLPDDERHLFIMKNTLSRRER